MFGFDPPPSPHIPRRRFLQMAGTIGLSSAVIPFAGVWSNTSERTPEELAADKNRALISITLDLEMSRNFPRWEDTEWDYEKGNLDAPTKQYALEAGRRVKSRGASCITSPSAESSNNLTSPGLKTLPPRGIRSATTPTITFISSPRLSMMSSSASSAPRGWSLADPFRKSSTKISDSALTP